MKNRAPWYIALALTGTLVLAGCGASSSAGPEAGQTPTGNQTPQVIAPAATTAASPLNTPATGSGSTAPATNTPATSNVPAPAPAATMAPTTPAALPTQAAPVATAVESTPAAAATAAGTPAMSGSLQPVSTALHSVATAKGFRMTTTITDTMGQTTSYKAEVVPPNSLHLTTPTNEYIVINNSGAWQKSSGGQWQKLDQTPAVADSVFALIDTNKIDQLVQSIDPSTLQSVGTETLSGKTMQVYQYSTTGQGANLMMSGKTKVWVGQDDGLLYQSETTGTAGATVFGQMVSGQVTINSVFEYDSSITVEPPM